MNLLSLENITKAYTERVLLDGASFFLQEGEKVGIIGINGTGKSTLLKLAAGLEEPDTGSCTKANHVVIRYLPQTPEFDDSCTVWEHVEKKISESTQWDMEGEAKSMLQTLGIVRLEQKISELSGGQRKRLALAEILMQPCDILVLDEPTNHLDIMSKEILEDALNGYEGTILYVSHDRYFINRTAHRILDLTEGQFVSYVGNYDYYLEKHDTVMAAIEANAPQNADADSGVAAKAAESEVKLDWKAQKEEQARLRKKENDLKKCEEKIAELEARISEIDTEMSDPTIGTQVAKLQELTKEQAACQEQLEKLYEQWEELAE